MTFYRLVLGVFLVLCCQACSQKPEPLLIGVLYSGETDSGQSLRMSALLAVEQINDTGGIAIGDRPKRPVSLHFEDTQSTQENALRAAMKLVEYRPLLVIGPNASQEMAAVVSLFEAERIPILTPAASLPDLVGNRKYVFRLVPSDQKQAESLARWTASRLKAKRPVSLYQANNAYSRHFAKSFQQALREINGSHAEMLSYVSGEKKYTRQIQQLQRLQPDVILLPNLYEDVINQMIRIRAAGIEAKFIGGDSWHPALFVSIPQAQDSWFIHHWLAESENLTDREKAFINAFESKYRLKPTVISALSYDCFQLAFDAIKRSKGDSPSVRFRLTTTDNFEGITGRVSFHRSGEPHRSVKLFHLINGQVKAVLADPTLAAELLEDAQ